jgi:hypothetical protein
MNKWRARAALLLDLLFATRLALTESGWEESAGASSVYVEAYSHDWTLRKDLASVHCRLRMLIVKNDINEQMDACTGIRSGAGSDCTEIWLSDNTHCNVLGYCDFGMRWQRVVEGSISVKGSPHATTLETGGEILETYASTEEDRYKLHVHLGRTGPWSRHSVLIEYDLENAVCAAEHLAYRRLPPGLASRNGDDDDDRRPEAHRFEFHCPWANWVNMPVRAISYSLTLPAPATLWSEHSPAIMLTRREGANESSPSFRHVTEQGQIVLRKDFTASELGIDEYAATDNFTATKLAFTWTTSEDSGVPVIVNHSHKPSDFATHRSCAYPKTVFSRLERDLLRFAPVLVGLVASLLSIISCCCCVWCAGSGRLERQADDSGGDLLGIPRRVSRLPRQVDDPEQMCADAHLGFVRWVRWVIGHNEITSLLTMPS